MSAHICALLAGQVQIRVNPHDIAMAASHGLEVLIDLAVDLPA